MPVVAMGASAGVSHWIAVLNGDTGSGTTRTRSRSSTVLDPPEKTCVTSRWTVSNVSITPVKTPGPSICEPRLSILARIVDW